MKKYYNIVLFALSLTLIVIPVPKSRAQTPLMKDIYSFSFKNETMDTIINELQNTVHFGFSYNPDIFPKSLKITKDFHNQTLLPILDSLVISNGYTYKIVGRNIAIAKCNKINPSNNDGGARAPAGIMQISGEIVDKATKKPISFANVYIKNKSYGTISNADGNFIIKIPNENVTDSLSFSCLGFKTYSKCISNISLDQNLIMLEPDIVYIKEVIVNYIDPVKLINQSISKISLNYSHIPLMYTAFYRETVRQNKDYVMLSEALLRIFKASYNSYTNDQVSIYKARKSPFVKQMDTVSFKFQGGIYTSLMLDIAKNQSTFLSEDFIKYYDFKLDEIASIQDQPVYVVSFDQKDDVPYALYKGKLYIDKKTYAIVRADFSISPKGIDRAAEDLVRKSPRKVKVKPISASYLVNYSERNNTWYLSNIREEVKFKVHKKFTFFNPIYHTVAELVVTNIDSTDVHRFKYNNTIHPNDIFVDKVGRYDENFWGNFNFIKPDESLEEALQHVEDKLKVINK